MKTLPETIEITFTEEDRQKAESFGYNCGCLVATALKRMGYKRVSEGCSEALINNAIYDHEWFGSEQACRDYYASAKPHYLPAVVGKTLLLTKRP